VLENAAGDLRFLVDPGWRTLVKSEDTDHIESLWVDFGERADLDPASLFKQLSSLGVGPLTVHEAGERISDRPALLELVSRFVQL